MKKVFPDAEAPNLIEQIQSQYGVSLKQIGEAMPKQLTQQTISSYKLGRIEKEQNTVIKRLKAILTGEFRLADKHSAHTLRNADSIVEVLQNGIEQRRQNKTIGSVAPLDRAATRRGKK